MTLTAKVTYVITPYMGDALPPETKYHTVDANSEEDASLKIHNYYYDVKSNNYGDYYHITEIDFFEHIK